MDNELLQKTIGAIVNIIQILFLLGGAFYAFYLAKGKDFIESKIGLIGDEKLRKNVQNAFDRVDELIEDGIISAEHTIKQEMIKDIEEGKVNKDSLKQIGVDVALNVKNQLSDKVVDFLKMEITDIEGYINSKVETQLAKLKLDPNSPVEKTTVQEPEVAPVDTTQLENENAQLKADKENLSQQNTTLQSDVKTLTQRNNDLVSEKTIIEQQNVDLQNKISAFVSQANQIVSSAQATVPPVVEQPIEQVSVQ